MKLSHSTTGSRRCRRLRNLQNVFLLMLFMFCLACDGVVSQEEEEEGEGNPELVEEQQFDDQATVLEEEERIETSTPPVEEQIERQQQNEQEEQATQKVPDCERLSSSLTYTQEEAPGDLSGLLPVVVERVNRVLDGVVDVEVEWTGADLNGRVIGEHTIRTQVTRISRSLENEDIDASDHPQRQLTTQCFLVPFTILDTNECKLPAGHAMRHQCHESAICVNTIGSYECVCPMLGGGGNAALVNEGMTVQDGDDFWARLEQEQRSPWEVSFNSSLVTSCPSAVSTHGCCQKEPETLQVKKVSSTKMSSKIDTLSGKQTTSCRSSFRCPADPCSSSSSNNCAKSATCQRKETPNRENPLMDQMLNNFDCLCPAGLMGNGKKCRTGIDIVPPQPKVKFDGVTPTEETIKNDYYCDCTKPVMDACSGFPPCQGKHEICTLTGTDKATPTCACKPGYFSHETYGCVDERPPVLKLKNDPNGDQTLRLKQGDVYDEYAVDIQDENSEDYLRSLKIAYSVPPHGCLSKIGEFHVNYTIATPWTSPPFVRITRRVIIEDIDECNLSSQDIRKFEKSCPSLIPKCDTDAGATCINTVGSYKCMCPKFTSGNGMVTSFSGGTSCSDTSKPLIALQGPNPKVFRVSQCGGVSGIMTNNKGSRKRSELQDEQQKKYLQDILEHIQETAGAELCATRSKPNPKPSDCVAAYDETYKGRIDLSKQVVIGDPIQESSLHWKVPYNVVDEAGNAAETVYRDVVVEEVYLDDFETKFFEDITKDRNGEIDAAVKKAVEADRKRRGVKDSKKVESVIHVSRKDECPICEYSGHFDESMCDTVCERRVGYCAVDEYSWTIKCLLWLEGFISLTAASVVLFVCVFGTLAFALQSVFTFVFSLREQRDSKQTADEREKANFNSVTYHNYPTSSHPPRESMSLGGGPRSNTNSLNDASIFSPRSPDPVFSSPSYQPNGYHQQDYKQPQQTPVDSLNDIYEITPSKQGDGVRRKSPGYGGAQWSY